MFSISINRSNPEAMIPLRFSIILMPYFVRYRLSNCRSLEQGYFLHSKQNCEPSSLSEQFFILQTKQWLSFWGDSTLQPAQLFFSRRNAIQMPQFIPQGAIRIDGMLVCGIIRYFLLFPGRLEPVIGLSVHLKPKVKKFQNARMCSEEISTLICERSGIKRNFIWEVSAGAEEKVTVY